MANPGDIWRPVRLLEPPAPRAAHSGDLLAPNLIVFWGGWNGAEALGELNIYEIGSSRWLRVDTTNQPCRRNNHASAVVDGVLYIHGGHNGIQWLQDLHAIDLTPIIEAVTQKTPLPSLAWNEVETFGRVPHARACHTLTHVRGALFLYGGYDGFQCYRDIDVLDLKSMTWSILNLNSGGALPEGRNAHSMTLVGHKLYMFGGHAGHHQMGDLHTFDLHKRLWTEIITFGNCPASPRGHGAAFACGRLVVFGGMSRSSRFQVVYSYSLTDQEWHVHKTSMTNNAPQARQRHSFTAINDREILLFGGFNGTNWLSDMHILNVQNLLHNSARIDQPVIGAMMNLYNSKNFVDMTIQTADGPIEAHKCIMNVQSDYFRTVIAKKNKSDQMVLDLLRWSGESVRSLVYFIYTSLIDRRDLPSVFNLLKLADYVGLNNLISDCEDIIQNHWLTRRSNELKELEDQIMNLKPSKLCSKLRQSIKQVDKMCWTVEPEGNNGSILSRSNASGSSLAENIEGDLTINLPRGSSRGSSSHFLFVRSAAVLGSSMFTNFY